LDTVFSATFVANGRGHRHLGEAVKIHAHLHTLDISPSRQFLNLKKDQLTKLLTITFFLKKVKYAYQELPHSEDTASLHSQEEERKTESMVIK
jgi:hypothetical protein